VLLEGLAFVQYRVFQSLDSSRYSMEGACSASIQAFLVEPTGR